MESPANVFLARGRNVDSKLLSGLLVALLLNFGPVVQGSPSATLNDEFESRFDGCICPMLHMERIVFCVCVCVCARARAHACCMQRPCVALRADWMSSPVSRRDCRL